MTHSPLLDKIKSVSVIGAGQMGAGIAQVLAQCGYKTTLHDQSIEIAKKGIAGIGKRLDRLVEKETISAVDKDTILSRLTPSAALDETAQSDLIIEAIIENVAIKCDLFTKLDSLAPANTLLASNTSSISITKLAAATQRPEKFVGMHFMNPVPVMKLVELIRGLQTSDETYEIIKALTLKLDKTPVTARFDYPGFIVNRILMPMINEACFVLQEGIATPEDIDAAMKLGTNQPMGPLTLADFIGLDTCLAICRIFQNELG